MNITRGKVEKAQKIVLYGPEGVGKTTFASQFPDPLFMDTEDGSFHMDVSRLDKPTSMAMVGKQLDFVKNSKPCKTLVIDTADWLELLITQHVCSLYQVDSIEKAAGGYGKGYVEISENYGRLLNKLNDIIDVGIHVVILAHSEITKFDDPLQLGAYDRYVLKLGKRVAPLLREWSDMLLFANYEINIVNVDGKGEMKGKNKAQGIARRKMYTTKTPGFDAKNRHGLPEELPLEFAAISEHINPSLVEINKANYNQDKNVIVENITVNEVSGEVTETTEEIEIHTVEHKEEDWNNVPQALQDLMKENDVQLWEIMNVLVGKGFAAKGQPFETVPPETVQGLMIAGWDKLYEFILEDRKMPF